MEGSTAHFTQTLQNQSLKIERCEQISHSLDALHVTIQQ